MALLTNINGKFSVSDAGAVTFNNAFTFPTADGTANYVLKTNGSGQLSWSPDNNNGDITGSGTANTVTKFTGAKTIGDGPITFSSNDSTFAGNISGVRGFFNSGATNVVATFTSTDATSTLQCIDGVGNVEFGANGNNFVVQPAGGVAQLTVGETNSTFAGDITFGDSHFIGDDADDNLLIQSSANENIIIDSLDDLFFRNSGTTNLTINGSGNATFAGKISSVKELVNINSANGIRSAGLESDSTGNIWLGTGTTAATINFVTGNSTNGTPSTNGVKRLTTNREGTDVYASFASNTFPFRVGYLNGSTYTPTFVIVDSGNVGIGETNPSEKLEVAGRIKIISTGSAHLILNGDTNNSGDTGEVDAIIDLLGDGNPGIYGYRINTENWSGQTALNCQEYLGHIIHPGLLLKCNTKLT